MSQGWDKHVPSGMAGLDVLYSNEKNSLFIGSIILQMNKVDVLVALLCVCLHLFLCLHLCCSVILWFHNFPAEVPCKLFWCGVCDCRCCGFDFNNFQSVVNCEELPDLLPDAVCVHGCWLVWLMCVALENAFHSKRKKDFNFLCRVSFSLGSRKG